MQAHAYHFVLMKLDEWDSIYLECSIHTYKYFTGIGVVYSWYLVYRNLQADP